MDGTFDKKNIYSTPKILVFDLSDMFLQNAQGTFSDIYQIINNKLQNPNRKTEKTFHCLQVYIVEQEQIYHQFLYF